MIPSPGLVAVLDTGKTNLKLLLATADGEPVHQLSHPNHFGGADPYPFIDTAGIEAWFLGALKELAPKYQIQAIIASTHGCTGHLCDENGPVLPMMDYEAVPPDWLHAAYARIAPPYSEVMTNVGPGVLRITQQLLWQSMAFPQAFGKARYFLAFPQYLTWRLCGRRASEISYIAAQSHLWAPLQQDFSSTVRQMGWQALFPGFVSAGAALGPIAPAVAALTGLDAGTMVLNGVHDSNANLYRYKAGGMAHATLLSTGTWMIGFDRDFDLGRLDEARGMISNVDIDGAPVSSTSTMAGREYALLAGEAPPVPDAQVLDAARGLVQGRTFALPSFAGNDGLFPGSAGKGRIIGPPPQNAAETRALAALYTAFQAHLCLDALESRDKPVIIDGGLAANLPCARLLAALRPGQKLFTSHSRDGTALGAALLWKRAGRSGPTGSVAIEEMAPAQVPGLAQAVQAWAQMAAAG